MTMSSADRDPVEQLAEEFAERYRRGERPSQAEYVAKYPQHADEIRELFPALVLMEQFKPADHEHTGPYAPDAGEKPPPVLGDYRILREVGRGGMGVVYEAEQVSLGRHVALKILAGPAALDAARRRRFEREARAAARLHHTNIVPVFGVGEQDGLHYYVMQFIPGLGLDEVLAELKAQRKGAPVPAPVAVAAGAKEGELALTAAEVAHSLLVGCASGDWRRGPTPLPSTSPAGNGQGVGGAPGSVPSADGSPVTVHGAGHAEHSTLLDRGRVYWQSVARLGAQVAEALAYAHAQGVLHRDIKPSNLLLDGRGNVWVTDFGLAKVLEDTDNLTHTGDIIGTMRYMAPERFRGQSDGRSDVYSLGLTLYELLALQPAFGAPDRSQLMRQVMHDDPPRPRALNPDVPRDLETIVLKAIDRDLSRRYSSAAALAEDLRRFVEDRPILARRASRRERLARWCRRNPALAATTSLAATALLAVAVVSVAFAALQVRSNEQLAGVNQELRDNQEKLEKEHQQTLDEQQHKEEAHRQSEENLAKFRRQSVLLAAERARALVERHEPNRALLWLVRALNDAPPDAADLQFLLRSNLASVRPEPAGPRTQLRPGLGIRAVSPDGKTVLRESGYPPQAQLWNVVTGQAIGEPQTHGSGVLIAAFSPDGKRLVTGGASGVGAERKGQIQFWDAATAKALAPPRELPSAVTCLAFSPDGTALLTGHADRMARFWDAATGTAKGNPLEIGGPAKPGRSISRVAFSPDGRTALTVVEKDVRLWDVATSKPRGEAMSHPPSVTDLAFSPDSRLVVTVANDKAARIWDVATGQAVGAPLPHRDPVRHVAFSPDGQTLATGGGLMAYDGGPRGELRLWRPTGEPLGPALQPEEVVTFLAFSPDGRVLLSAGERVVRLWDATSGRPLGKPLLQEEDVGGVLGLTVAGIFSADSRRVLTRAGTCELQDTSSLPRILPHDEAVIAVAFSPDGKRIITGTQGLRSINGGPRYATLWDVATCQPFGEPMRHADRIPVVAFSPDASLVLTGSGAWDGTAQLWHADSGKRFGPPLEYGFGSSLQVGKFSTDGRTVLLGGYAKEHGQTARMWDVLSGQRVGAALAHGQSVSTLAYSPDGRSVVTGSEDHTAQLWNATTGRPLSPPLKHEDRVESVAFSPDGTRVLTASRDRTARLWDATSGQELLVLRHEDAVVRADFSPDGTRVLTASADRTARLWDANSGAPIGLPWQHPDRLLCAAFSPDGRVVVTGCEDGQARLWAAETGLLIGSPWPHPRPVTAAAFSPDGRTVLTACGDHAARLWDVPAPVAGDPGRLVLRVEAETGLELDAGGAVHRLEGEALAERRRRLQQAGAPHELIEEREGGTEWHRRVAMVCADRGHWFGAAWHLDRVVSQRPDDWSALLLRGEAHVKLGQLDRAAADYAQAFKVGPGERVRAACSRQAEEYEKGNEWRTDKAEREKAWQTALWYLDRMIEARPQDWALYDRRGSAQAALGHDAAAEANYRQAVALGPDASFFYRSLGPANGETGWGLYHLRRRDWDRAAFDFARAFELGSDAPSVWQYHALLRLHAGDRDGYRRACAALLARRKDSWYFGLSALVAETCTFGADAVEDPWLPVQMAERAAQDPSRGRSYLATLGETLYRAGCFDLAVPCLEEGLKSPNAVPDGWFFLAMAHQRLGHADEAKKWGDKAAEWLEQRTRPKAGAQAPFVSPGNLLEALVLSRELEELAKRDEEGLAELTQAVEARPDDPGPRVQRGRFQANRGRWEEAVADLTRATELRPDDPQLWLERGRCYARWGERRRAAADFTRAAGLRPDDLDLRRECGRACAACGAWEEAATELARAVAGRPDDAAVRVECGEAHASCGRWERAAADFRRATEIKPDDAWAWYLLALADLGGDNTDGYRQTCAAMRERFGKSPEPSVVQRLFYACAVTPDAVADWESFADVARRFGMFHRDWYREIGGAVLYRSGQFEAAVKRFNSSLTGPVAAAQPWDCFFLAMAQQRLGRAGEARDLLARGVAWMEAANRQEGGSLGNTRPGWDQWRERVIARALRREAEKLVREEKPAAK
jgi:WD40 repeat protein/serine/threonine protein kinase/Flp pilus assembly protein TadD